MIEVIGQKEITAMTFLGQIEKRKEGGVESRLAKRGC